MYMQINKWPSPLALFLGIAVILFSAAGTAAIKGWEPAPIAGSSAIPRLDDLMPISAVPVIHTRPKCAECGVILSMREIDTQVRDANPGARESAIAGNRDEMTANPARNYEFTIRMADGSLRLINDENPAMWRLGERVVVIDSNSMPAQ